MAGEVSNRYLELRPRFRPGSEPFRPITLRYNNCGGIANGGARPRRRNRLKATVG